ncbi:MAG: hypothetical protein IBX61_08645 [Thermoleophilia bacterium]|nr:hypothetical protein [Thermoleophilia bacterium]
MFQSVLRSFAISRAMVVLFAALGHFLLPSVQDGKHVPLSETTPWFLSMWYRWDANWYMSIIAQGYEWVPDDQSNVAFFPLYPLMVKVLGLALGERYLMAGMALSTLFLISGMVFLYRLVREDYGEKVAGRAVLLLAIFPTSVYFSSLYTESLFLLSSVAAFYYARQGRWALVGGWGLLASLTRIAGLWLLLPLLWEYLSQKNFSLRRMSPKVVWLALLPGGIALYMSYLYLAFGRPLAFADAQMAGWAHELSTVWGSVAGDLDRLLNHSELWPAYDLAAAAVVAACLVLGLRKLRGSYNIYLLVSLLAPFLGGTSKSMSRYMLVIFPVFIVMALYSGRPVVRYSLYAVSVALLALTTAMFISGRWVA